MSDRFLSIFFAGKGTERERNAVNLFLDEMVGYDIPLLLSYNTAFDLSIIKYALNLHFRVVVIVPFGLLNLKTKKEIQSIWDDNNISFLSLTMPYQEWKSYENVNVFKFRLQYSSIQVFASEDFHVFEKSEKEIIKSNSRKFYLKFWTDTVSFFNEIHATQIGRNPSSNRPNVQPIINCILDSKY